MSPVAGSHEIKLIASALCAGSSTSLRPPSRVRVPTMALVRGPAFKQGVGIATMNPMTALGQAAVDSRCLRRDRHHVSGAKSDAGDAKLLADLVRTDRHNHRPIAGDSPDAEAIKLSPAPTRT